MEKTTRVKRSRKKVCSFCVDKDFDGFEELEVDDDELPF